MPFSTGNEISLVPQPVRIDFSGRWLPFDGFDGFPLLLHREFGVPRGSSKITVVDGVDNGVEIDSGFVRVWGDTQLWQSTLCQLSRLRPGYLPVARISEKMSFRFRGYHLDIARGGVPTLKFFKRLLRLLFWCKYTHLAIYFEDLFPWKQYPQIGAGRGRLTRKELNEVVAYGARLGVEVLPSLSLLGHMENILNLLEFQRYSETKPTNGTINAADQKAIDFACDLLAEVLDFFQSAEYIHVGGDEPFGLGNGKSQCASERLDGPRLYEKHMARLLSMVKERDKKPIMWGDPLTGKRAPQEETEEWKALVWSRTWDDVYIANWNYEVESQEEARRWVNDYFGNATQLVCPGLQNWGRFYPNFERAICNIRCFLGAAEEAGLPGFLVTAWGDHGSECLYSLLEPLVLATMDIAEGDGCWHRKWLAYSGESADVLDLRIDLSAALENSRVDLLKMVLLKGKVPCENDTNIWRSLLARMSEFEMDYALRSVGFLIEYALRRLSVGLDAGEAQTIASLYKEAWLCERKTENVQVVTDRLIRHSAGY